MSEEKITLAQLREMFGETMPMEAVSLICYASAGETVGKIRAQLRAIAAKRNAPVCHCGKDGHPLYSVSCPVHGYDIVRRAKPIPVNLPFDSVPAASPRKLSEETKDELRRLAEHFSGYANSAEEWLLDARGWFQGRRRAGLTERAMAYRAIEAMLRGRANGEYDDDYDPLPLHLAPADFDAMVAKDGDIVGIPMVQRGDDASQVWPRQREPNRSDPEFFAKHPEVKGVSPSQILSKRPKP
jgi:hypothetical protein